MTSAWSGPYKGKDCQKGQNSKQIVALLVFSAINWADLLKANRLFSLQGKLHFVQGFFSRAGGMRWRKVDFQSRAGKKVFLFFFGIHWKWNFTIFTMLWQTAKSLFAFNKSTPVYLWEGWEERVVDDLISEPLLLHCPFIGWGGFWARLCCLIAVYSSGGPGHGCSVWQWCLVY